MHNNIGIKSIIFRGKTKFLGLVLKIKIKNRNLIYIYILLQFRSVKKKLEKIGANFWKIRNI